MQKRKKTRWLMPLLAGGAFVALTLLEARRPLRRRIEPRGEHLVRNLVVTAITAAVVGPLQTPFIQPALDRVRQRRLGILNMLGGPLWLRDLLGVLLLDYTLWHWHFMNHRVAFLWRFHLAHHIDRDLDASTALRFHFGEMTLSIPYRMLQIRLLGISERALTIWQNMLILSVLFHHSNLRLPRSLDEQLVGLVVTPRMHGIHHSDWLEETDSNWSSLLSVWDLLHGTFRYDIPQAEITIGVPAYRDDEQVTLGATLALPFRKGEGDWVDERGMKKIRRPAAGPPLPG
jgi:sterol desaturase/sphingolipid hydroxylase (fatty acid hydroxylase superfamily)